MNKRLSVLLLTVLLILCTAIPTSFAAGQMGTVTFPSDLAAADPAYATVNLPIGSTFTLPPGPANAPFLGMVFRDWSVNGSGRYSPGESIVVQFRTTISPNWDVPGSNNSSTGSSTGASADRTVFVQYGKDWDGTAFYSSFMAAPGSTFVLPEAPVSKVFLTPFSHWEINGVRYNPGDTVTVPDAAYMMIQVVWDTGITPQPDDGMASISFTSGWSPEIGGLSPGNMETITLPKGSVCTLPEPTFRAPSGKYFIGWLIHEQFYSPGESIVLDRDYLATAAWENNNRDWSKMETFPVRVQVDMGRGGMTYPNGEVTVARGESLTVTITPDPGYYLAVLQINGRTTEPTYSLTLHSISIPYIVNAMFLPTEDGVTPPLAPPQYPAPTPVNPVVPEIPVISEIPYVPVISEIPSVPLIPETPSVPDEPKSPYEDVPASCWYAPDVVYVTDHGLMNGVGDGLFAPDEITSRAMLVTILWRMEGQPAADTETNFDDVADGTWYTDAVRWAASRGIVNGYGDGCFGPADPLTREQMLAILYRYASDKSWTETGLIPIAREYVYSDWAEEGVFWGENHSILEDLGTDVTDQTAEVPRAEAAAYLRRFCENVKP